MCQALGSVALNSLLLFILFFNVYLFLRERDRGGGGAKREGDTESEAGSRLQAPNCQHRA